MNTKDKVIIKKGDGEGDEQHTLNLDWIIGRSSKSLIGNIVKSNERASTVLIRFVNGFYWIPILKLFVVTCLLKNTLITFQSD